jgi:hypothetical protein
VWQVADNAEIQALLRILNLDTARPDVAPAQLRYGHVMLMTDQARPAPYTEWQWDTHVRMHRKREAHRHTHT